MEKTISLNVEDLFTPKKQELEDLAKKHEVLRKKKVGNKAELEIVHNAEQELVKTRTGISKLRKEYTAPLEKAKKDAILKENELLGVISPVEEDLKTRKKEFLEEEERKKQEKLEEKRKFLQDRVDALAKVLYSHTDLHTLSQMSEEGFQELLADQTKKFDDKQKELEAEKTIKVKNEIRSEILSAKDKNDIDNSIETIKNSGFDIDEFKTDIDAKSGMIEQQEKMNADQKRIDDENQKIADEKQKIQDEKDEKKRLDDLEIEKEKARKEGEDQAKEDAKKQKLEDERIEKENQQKMEKKKMYQKFLKENSITDEGLDSKELIYKKNDEARTMTFYKKIAVYNF